MLLAGEAALLALALIYSLEEIIYNCEQGREKQWISFFYFLLQVVIIFKK